MAGHYFLKKEIHFFEDVSVKELGYPQTPEDLWRALNNYGDRRYACGAVFPTGNEWGNGENKVYGAIFIRREAVEWRDVPVCDLGDPQNPDDFMRGVTAYAERNVFCNGAAFPTFHKANYGHGWVAGVFFIRPEYVRHYDIPIDHLSRYPDCGMHYVPNQPDQGPSMIRLLTRQGADASMKTYAGESVRHIVTNAGSGASKKLVWDTEDFFCLIALNLNLHFAKAMLERGQIDVNLGIELRYEKGLESVPQYARDENRNAAMWIIACHRDPELLRLVMATGMVDLLHTTTTGWNVAHMSAHVGVNNDHLGAAYVRELAKSPKAKYIFWQAKTRNFGGLLAVQISKNPQFGPELGINTHQEILKLRP